ncbi:MAG: lipase secretion chaperone [Rhodoferax sp.]|nr:lipase secretion chaperone [Rhodoferax sp.]
MFTKPASKAIVWGLSALALLFAAWLLWPDAENPVPASTTAPAPAGALPFAKSMQGTDPDGDLKAWAAAHNSGQASAALPYAELRRLFDYYLSAIGERDLASIVQQIRLAIDQSLEPAQSAAAKHLLERYIEFKRALVELEKNPTLNGSGIQAIRARFAAMQDLRAQIFSTEEDRGMFEFEDVRDMDALARLEITEDKTLSAAQKRDRLATLDASMPAALRASHDAPRVVIKVEDAAKTMRENGASDDDIYRMRAKELNPQAASRLAEVDREEQAWKQRIDAYLAARAKILKDKADAPESERQAALNELQNAQFDADERRRLAAYEQ